MKALETIGIYLHIPFCDGKCPYCDFYSLRGDESRMEEYAAGLGRAVVRWSKKEDRPVDSVYFGGGTPVLLGARRLCGVLAKIRENFTLLPGAEITVEANPAAFWPGLWETLRAGGFNRLSLGLQSADDGELKRLGRRHTAAQADRAVQEARRAGFSNVSVDLMLGIPGQTLESLDRSVRFCAGLGASHVSAYLLKVEEGTPFAARERELFLPDEEEQRAFYLRACEGLERAGYGQYEISNFARPGRESRHNLRYWDCREYIGIGPSAHSFYQGRRLFYPRDFEMFLRGAPPCDDGPGGDWEEYLMLRLRLADGIRNRDFASRYGRDIPQGVFREARRLERLGLTACADGSVRLTREGFLVSNEIICQLLLAAEPEYDAGET